MPEVSYEIKGEGFAKLVNEFNQLTKAEQRAAVEASKISGELSKSSRKSNEFRKMARGALEFAGALGAAVSAASLISGAIDRARDSFRKLQEEQKRAARGQDSFAGAFGKLLTNDPSLAKDRNKLNDFRNFALNQGKILGKGGAAQIAGALASVRSATGGLNITDEQRKRAITRAIKAKQVDSSVNIAEQAEASLRVQVAGAEQAKRLGVSSEAFAETAVGGLAGAFAGDAGAALKVAPKVLASAGLGASTAGSLSLFSLISGAIGDKQGDVSSTVLSGLAAGVQTGRKVGGRNVKFTKGASVEDKIIEFLDQVERGEFGKSEEDKAKALKDFTSGAGGQESLRAVANILNQGGGNLVRRKVGDFKNLLKNKTSSIDQNFAAAAEFDPGFLARQDVLLAQGQADVADILDTAGARRERIRQKVEAKSDAIGATPVAPLDVVGGTVNKVAGVAGATGAISTDKQEQQQLLNTLLQGAGLGFTNTGAAATAAALNPGLAGLGSIVLPRIGKRGALRSAFLEGGEEGFFKEAARLGLLDPSDGDISRFEIAAIEKLAPELEKTNEGLRLLIDHLQNVQIGPARQDNDN